jgi:NAD-dependent dihydropyrimidine dehydrogenase PreA subunit
MSKTWYPVIDYSLCEECGACVSKCSHGVFDKAKSPSPKVVNPEGCVQGCHGCGNLCPTEAINYVGEQNQKDNNCCCSCDDSENGGCC